MLQCDSIYARGRADLLFSCEIEAPKVSLFDQYFSCTCSQRGCRTRPSIRGQDPNNITDTGARCLVYAPVLFILQTVVPYFFATCYTASQNRTQSFCVKIVVFAAGYGGLKSSPFILKFGSMGMRLSSAPKSCCT